jgi:hypothetical protein
VPCGFAAAACKGKFAQKPLWGGPIPKKPKLKQNPLWGGPIPKKPQGFFSSSSSFFVHDF